MTISCVRFKSSVVLDPMTPTLARLLCAVDMTARMMGVDLTVSCGREGHGPTDPHTLGAALDISVFNLTPDLIVRSLNYMQAGLGELFYMQYEVPGTPVNGALKNIAVINPQATAPHFHVQAKKGTVYPPQDSENGQQA